MKKQRILAALLMIFLLPVLLLTGPRAAATEDLGQILRIGIKFGSGVMPGANLLNRSGSGYQFGYYDNSHAFVQLGYTAEKAVSTVKTQNVRYDGRNYTDSGSGVMVGCYHIGVGGSYGSFEEAKVVANQYNSGFVAYIRGAYQVRVGNYASNADANAALANIPNGSIVGTSAYGVSVVATGSNTILFQYDSGDETGFGIRPDSNGDPYAITWFADYSYYGGFRYTRIGGGDLTVVNMVPLELYVRGIVPYEMSNTWPLEALKAQAVCARTYAVRNTGLSKHRSSGFDLCTTTCCQAYRGTGLANAHSDSAVIETAGEFVMYENSYAETYYFSSSGGATEDVRNVWNPNGNLPYLLGVYDHYETSYADKIPGYRYTVTYTKSDLQEIVRKQGGNCGEVANFYIAEFTPTGNVKTVTIVDVSGKRFSYSRDNVRILFPGIRSLRYMVSGGGTYFVNQGEALGSVDGAYVIGGTGNIGKISGSSPYVITGSGTQQLAPVTAGNTFTVTGTGYGHNVGMSQYGARVMAEEGLSYRDIITFYYTGVRVGN
jgi:SpoIID/LytB domain